MDRTEIALNDGHPRNAPAANLLHSVDFGSYPIAAQRITEVRS
jgi:hypothetical protein